jgi:Domain of unknown function (DUF397)
VKGSALAKEITPVRDEDGWFVSSFTNGGGSCVQVKFAGQDAILVRDSKDRRAQSPIIGVPSHSWATLLNIISSNQS